MSRRIESFLNINTMDIKTRPDRTVEGQDAGEDLVIRYNGERQLSGYGVEPASRHPEHAVATLKLIRRSS